MMNKVRFSSSPREKGLKMVQALMLVIASVLASCSADDDSQVVKEANKPVAVQLCCYKLSANTNDSTIKVGQVLCADGSICDYHKRGNRTPVALVVYAGKNTGNSKYNRGLAMALDDCSEGTQWGPFGYENPKNSFPLNIVPGEDGACYRTGKYIKGSFTAFHISVYGNPAAPKNTTGWFLPSACQMKTVIQCINEKGMALNSCFAPVGGANMSSWYWTCTEYDDFNAIYYKASGAIGHESKLIVNNTRAMLAF